MTDSASHRMLVVHNLVGSSDRLRVIEEKPFRKYGFGRLLGYADEVAQRMGGQRMLVTHSLALPGGVSVYEREQLEGISVGDKYDSVLCYLVMDHGGVVAEDFFSALRADFLEKDGVLLNPVRSIAKKDVARASQVELETQTAPCVIKKDDNYNNPGTVFEIHTEAELDAWRAARTPEEQKGYVTHKLLRYFDAEPLQLHQLERWIIFFGDLTVNYRCSDGFYVKVATSLSYYVRDERRLKGDLERLAASKYDWKGRSIDCAYSRDPEAWDARYAVVQRFRDYFRFDCAELDVIQSAKNEFVVIDVNNTPGHYHQNVHWRELAVQLLVDELGLRPSVVVPPAGVSPAGNDDAHEQFRLAEAELDAGRLEQARAAFSQRAAMEHGDAEERFLAQLEVGRLCVRLEEPEAVVLGALLGAYSLRPTRAEPLYELACYYRKRQAYAMASLFAKAGVRTPRPEDRSFVAESIYAWQLQDELGVAAYWIGDYATSQKACEAVLAKVEAGLEIPDVDALRIRRNLVEAQGKLTQT